MCTFRLEFNTIWFTGEGMAHTHTHTHMLAIQPLKHVGLPNCSNPFCSILHFRAPSSHIADLSNSKEVVGQNRHSTWHLGSQHITFSCSFVNFECWKSKDRKHSLHLVFQDFLCVLCNKNNKLMCLKTYSNTDWTNNTQFCKGFP